MVSLKIPRFTPHIVANFSRSCNQLNQKITPLLVYILTKLTDGVNGLLKSVAEN